MELLRTRDDLARLDDIRRGGPLVLVPTMGALHAGHLSLVDIGRRLGTVVATIFVNPAQFAPGEDLDAYPRDLEGDLALLRERGAAAVWAPDASAVYPDGPGGVEIRPGPRADRLCGATRPGHFAGVLKVVAKLFNLVRPDVAVFGRKDAQQCLVVAEMVRDLDFPVRLVDGPTVREPDGLAMSSRNRYLAGEARVRARCLHEALTSARRLLDGGERDPAALRSALRDGLAPADAVDYAEVLATPDLEPPAVVRGPTLVAVAARVGPARLIDNLSLDVGPDGVRERALLGGEETA